jgi:sensor histidine kinase YesM
MLIVLISFITIFYVFINLSTQLSSLFEQSEQFTQLSGHLSNLEDDLEVYLDSKDSDAFVRIMNEQVSIKAYINDEQPVKNTLKVHQINSIVQTIVEETDSAIANKRARHIEAYVNSFNKIQEQILYVDELIDEANLVVFENNLKQYQNLNKMLDTLKVIFIILAIVMFVLALSFAIDFTRGITTPLNSLIFYAKEISKGKYPKEIKLDSSYEEAFVLRDTFVNMSSSIENYINELKEQNEMERKLTDYELNQLKLENNLKQAELKALHSQINPHFLFNTLNAGLQLANIEDAEETAEFIESLSTMLRYNLQNTSSKVSLEDEFKNLENYFKIMKVRFQDMQEYYISIDDSIKKLEVPPIILQPIVENAVIHGFKDKIDVGIIKVDALDLDNRVEIRISDNGWGMKQSKIYMLKQSNSDSNATKGHTTGIGIGNVFEKMRLMFGDQFKVKIESELGVGTTFILIIRKENNHD